jgi:hypothetical protein
MSGQPGALPAGIVMLIVGHTTTRSSPSAAGARGGSKTLAG